MCGYINIIKQTFVYFVKEGEFSLRWQSINCMYFKIVTACCFKILLKQTVNQALKFEIFFKPIFKQSCLYACKCNYKLFFSIFFKPDTTTLEYEANSDETTQTLKQERKNTGRLLIILAGSAVSLALILIIIHELYAYHHMSHPIGVNHVENDVYEDIAADNDQRLLRCLWYECQGKRIWVSLTECSESFESYSYIHTFICKLI